jgi:hypothetical protein
MEHGFLELNFSSYSPRVAATNRSNRMLTLDVLSDDLYSVVMLRAAAVTDPPSRIQQSAGTVAALSGKPTSKVLHHLPLGLSQLTGRQVGVQRREIHVSSASSRRRGPFLG